MNTLLLTRDKLTNIKKTTCAGALVEVLTELKIDSIFGYPGASVLSIYNELAYTNKIKHYLARHEQAAMHAAEGYARTGNRAGVVLVTSGPGFTNTVTGIANAYADSTPLIVLAGDVPVKNKKGKVFQNVNIKSITESCAKKTYILSPKDDIKEVLKNAYSTAMTNPKGPVVIVLPRDILESEYKFYPKKKQKTDEQNIDFKNEINKLQALIKKSKKPLIIIGGGAINSSEEIKQFVSKINCPVVSTLMGIGIYPSSNQDYLGMTGINGTYIANYALNQADLLIALGVAFSDRSTCKNAHFAKKTKIASINIDSISSDFELEIKSDITQFLQSFNSYDFSYNMPDNWLKQIDLAKSENVTFDKQNEKMHSSFVLETLSKLTSSLEPIVVTDVGQHQMLTAQFFDFNKPRKFITSGGLGTMGFGLPASIGAYIANPDKLVLNITGDGSFQMNLQELATCREHNIPIKIIIMNNGYLGMVRQMQEKLYKKMYQVEMTNPDFTKIAEAYDLFAIRVNNKNELIPALKKAIEYNGTAIVDIIIDSFENI